MNLFHQLSCDHSVPIFFPLNFFPRSLPRLFILTLTCHKMTISPLSIPYKGEETETLHSYVRFLSYVDTEDGSHIYVFKVLRSDINDENWNVAIKNVKLFLKWIRKTNMMYHFVFDIHECEVVPAQRLYYIQSYLAKKKELLKTYLHSSVVITKNRIVQLLLTTAFNFTSPTRPIKIILCEDSEEEGNMELPESTYKEAVSFLSQNKLHL